MDEKLKTIIAQFNQVNQENDIFLEVKEVNNTFMICLYYKEEKEIEIFMTYLKKKILNQMVYDLNIFWQPHFNRLIKKHLLDTIHVVKKIILCHQAIMESEGFLAFLKIKKDVLFVKEDIKNILYLEKHEEAFNYIPHYLLNYTNFYKDFVFYDVDDFYLIGIQLGEQFKETYMQLFYEIKRLEKVLDKNDVYFYDQNIGNLIHLLLRNLPAKFQFYNQNMEIKFNHEFDMLFLTSKNYEKINLTPSYADALQLFLDDVKLENELYCILTPPFPFFKSFIEKNILYSHFHITNVLLMREMQVLYQRFINYFGDWQTTEHFFKHLNYEHTTVCNTHSHVLIEVEKKTIRFAIKYTFGETFEVFFD